MRIKHRIWWAWRGWTGAAARDLKRAEEEARHWEFEASTDPGSTFSLRQNLTYAKAAIAELRSRLPKDWEQLRKKESDALAEAKIADMKANPQKYIGEREP